MSYNLFIDDQIDDWSDELQRFIRDPKIIDPTRVYVAVKTVTEAKDYISANGCPLFISFDFDLGLNAMNQKTQSDELAYWIVQMDMDQNKTFIPEGFNYQVHSKNITAENNLAILNNWLKSRESWTPSNEDDEINYRK